MGCTRDVLEKDEVEHVTGDGDIELADDHAGDVGSEEDSGEKEDADNVPVFLCACFFRKRFVFYYEVCYTQYDVENRDTDGSDDGWNDDGDGNGSRTKASLDLVTDRTRKVHGFTEDLIGQDSVDEGDEPYKAYDALVKDGWTLEPTFLCAWTLPK